MPGFFHFHSLLALALVLHPTGAGKVISNLPVPTFCGAIAMSGSSGGSVGSGTGGWGASTGISGACAGTGAGTPDPMEPSRLCADAA